MENHQHSVQVKKGDEWINLWFIGDWHLGSVACDEKKIDRDIKKIEKSENPQVFLMGDHLNAICYRDKRFDPMDIHPRYRDRLGDIFRWQLKTVWEKVYPIYDKIVGAHIGNHELACRKYFQYDVHADLIEAHGGWKDLRYTALTRIEVKKDKPLYDFVVHTRHGVGKVQTMRIFQNRTQHITADIKVCGHNHQLGYERVDTLEQDNEKPTGDVRDNPRIWGFSGSYLRTYASGLVGYGEEAGYPPVPLGCLNIKVRRDAEGRLEFEAKTT